MNYVESDSGQHSFLTEPICKKNIDESISLSFLKGVKMLIVLKGSLENNLQYNAPHCDGNKGIVFHVL